MNTTRFNFERFFELTSDLVCVASYDGYFKKVNSAVSQTLGYSFEELYSQDINAFVHPEDRNQTSSARMNLTKSNGLHHFENRYITKNGDIVWLAWTSIPSEEDKVIFAIAKDISHKKRLDSERNAHVLKLSKNNKIIEQINYKTSHDLRAPINNMNSILNLIELDNIEDEKTKKLLLILKKGGIQLKEKMNAHINWLISTKNTYVKIESILFDQTIEKALDSINNLVSKSGAIIRTDFSKAPIVEFNSDYLESIFLNLITNSIKYTRPENIPRIKIETQDVASHIKFTYEDNGVGFDLEKIKDKIFGFHQTFHHNEDSKGIGLYLVHSHITSLGGTISVESEMDKGAKFTIMFKKGLQIE